MLMARPDPANCEAVKGSQERPPPPAAPAQEPPARLLEPSPLPGDPGSLPQLRDAAAAFPGAGSVSSKAELVSARHTHRTRTGH